MRSVYASVRCTVLLVALSLSCGVSAWAQEPPAPRTPPRPPETAFEPRGFVPEPSAITRATVFADRHSGNGDRTDGHYIGFWNIVPGAGIISGGPGYRKWYSGDRAVLDGSIAVSNRGYKMAQARFELPQLARSRIALGTQLRLQDFPQVTYFGSGPDTRETNRSEYRLKSANVVGYATYRLAEWLALDARAGWLKPSISRRAGLFKSDRPDAGEEFPNDVVFAAPDPTFIHTELSLTADTRDFANHPTRGALYRAAAANYSDRERGTFSFRRYEAQAAQFLPLLDSRVVVALHGWLAASDTADGRFVPFYLQPSLGGADSLRSYPDYRFHDRHLLLFTGETRVALTTHMDGAVFIDAGNVAPRLGDLNLGKRSYGAGLRLHTRRHTYARLDVAHGGEGWRVLVRVTDPLSLSRLLRRTAAVPFVP